MAETLTERTFPTTCSSQPCNPSTLALVPVFLAALLVARRVPALAYRSLVGERGVVVAGLLQSPATAVVARGTKMIVR